MSASTNETDMSTPTIVQIVSTKHQTDYSKSTINPVSITSELQTSTNIPSRTSTVTQTKNYSTQNSTDYSKSTSVKPKKVNTTVKINVISSKLPETSKMSLIVALPPKAKADIYSPLMHYNVMICFYEKGLNATARLQVFSPRSIDGVETPTTTYCVLEKPKKKKCCVSGNPTDRLGTILFPVLMLFGLYSIVCSTGQVAGPILLAILHCLGQIFTPCVRPHPTIGLFIPPAHTYLSFHTVLGTHQFSQQGICNA
ncbi:hypothetical protein GQR58_029473 [Nymphon striatum]|nr:hypothetical protein GQR58_029473 [Nymphon striatum]